MQLIPPPHAEPFVNGIRHPRLFLLDAWSYETAEMLHLYSLALPRFGEDGKALAAHERNDYPFHIRHFTSGDNGLHWKDQGCFLDPQAWSGKSSYYTVWSGSIQPMPDGSLLTAVTVLERIDEDHKFLQHIGLAVCQDGNAIQQMLTYELSSPRRDWEQLRNLGYYMAEPKELGANEGEAGGPILAWRDPFLMRGPDEALYLFWGGKVGPSVPALVRAKLTHSKAGYVLQELYPPALLPDGSEFTQLELPKVVHDAIRGIFYLLVSTCNRVDEAQADSEIEKSVRLYKSTTLVGDWQPLGDPILQAEQLYGVTILRAEFEHNRLLCTGPYTDAAGAALRLTFSRAFYIYLQPLRVEFLLGAQVS